MQTFGKIPKGVIKVENIFFSENSENVIVREGIWMQYASDYTPQQNGVVKRVNRTIVEPVRSMLHDSRLPKQFWSDAIHLNICSPSPKKCRSKHESVLKNSRHCMTNNSPC